MSNIKENELEIKIKYPSKMIIIHGEAQGYLSPYDVPRKAKVSFNNEKNLFSIDFDYLTPNEPRDKKTYGGGVTTLYFGKTSGKLYSINIHCQSKEQLPELVSIEVTPVLGELIADSKDNPNRLVEYENLSTTKAFLEEEPSLKRFMEKLAV